MLSRQIRVLGDTAIVWEKVRQVGGAEGRPIDKSVQLARIWHSQDGQWRVVAFHATEPGNPPPSP